MDQRTIVFNDDNIEVDYLNFVSLPDLSELIGVKSDETLLMGIS